MFGARRSARGVLSDTSRREQERMAEMVAPVVFGAVCDGHKLRTLRGRWEIPE